MIFTEMGEFVKSSWIHHLRRVQSLSPRCCYVTKNSFNLVGEFWILRFLLQHFLGNRKIDSRKRWIRPSLGKFLIEKIWTKHFSSFPLFAAHVVQDALLDLNSGLCTSRMPIGYSGRTGFPNRNVFFRMWRFLDIKHRSDERSYLNIIYHLDMNFHPLKFKKVIWKMDAKLRFQQLFQGVKMMNSLFSNFAGGTLFGNRTCFSWFCWSEVSRCFMGYNDRVGGKSPVFFLENSLIMLYHLGSFNNRDI